MTGILSGVDVAGAALAPGASFDAAVQLYLFYYSTPTERTVLEAFAQQALPSDAQIAWACEERNADHIDHTGLIEGLSVSDVRDVIPVGVAWKPKTAKQQSWREIASWMHLVDSDFRQARALKYAPERCAVSIG